VDWGDGSAATTRTTPKLGNVDVTHHYSGYPDFYTVVAYYCSYPSGASPCCDHIIQTIYVAN